MPPATKRKRKGQTKTSRPRLQTTKTRSKKSSQNVKLVQSPPQDLSPSLPDFDPAELSDSDRPDYPPESSSTKIKVQNNQLTHPQLLFCPVKSTDCPKTEFFLGFPDSGPPIKPEPSDPNINGFKSMGGCSHLYEEIRTRILFPIVNPSFMRHHGRTLQKGIILHGPPGTGKTLFAKCLAAELSRLKGQPYKFFMRRGPDVLNSLIGESEKNLQAIFAKARSSKPSILFFDEVDALSPDRNKTQECSSTVNLVCTLLGEMDKVVSGEVLILFATNRLSAVDPALLRPGRCDLSLQFFPPNFEGRKEILQLYTQKWGQSSLKSTLLSQLASGTNGFTGADLNKLCSEAFFNCVRRIQREPPKGKHNKLAVKTVNGAEKVTVKDWLEALGSMRPSKSNVFGSYVQTLEISQFALPLIQNVGETVADYFRHILPVCHVGGDGAEQGSKVESSSSMGQFGGPNGYLLVNACPKSDDIVDSILVPTVLSHFSSFTAFLLNEETLLQGYNSLTMNAINEIVRQAKECQKPSILFIPRIDILAKRLGGEAFILRRLLFNSGSGGTPLTVLATAGGDVSSLPQQIQPIFDGLKRVFRVSGAASEKARREFFSSIFCEQEEGKQRKGSQDECEDALMELLDECVEITSRIKLGNIITLHRELFSLWEEGKESQDKTQMLEQMGEVISQFRQDELEAGRREDAE